MQLQTVYCAQPGQALYGFPFSVDLPNASITVYLTGTTTRPTLYDKAGDPLSNPFSASIIGIGQFRAANGVYDILVQSADLSFSSPLIEGVQLFDFSDISGISNLAADSDTGILARTGEDAGVSTYAARTITGAAGKVSVANGDGVAGNPTIAIASGAIGPTELASGAAVANIGFTPEIAANKSTDGTFAANSDTNYPSQKATKTYVTAIAAAAQSAALAGNFTGSWRGIALSSDTLLQGQAYAYDATTNQFHARSIEAINYVTNSGFDWWQENTTYTFGGSAPKVQICDFFKVAAPGGTSYTASRAAGFSGSLYALKIQRNTGQTNVSRVRVAQQLGLSDSSFLAGKTVVFSFDVLAGANFTSTSFFVQLHCGTGTDEDIDLHVNTPNFVTGGTTVGGGTLTAPAVGTSTRLVTSAMVIPAGTTEICIDINNSSWIGTAGADDSFTIANVKLEVASVATHYRKPLMADEIARVKRRYETSFVPGTVPAQNVGTGTGELRWRRGQATTGKEGIYQMFAVEKRSTPAITLANPAAADTQVRNLTGSADCTLSTAQNITQRGFEIDATGNSGGAVGDTLAIHWIADARL